MRQMGTRIFFRSALVLIFLNTKLFVAAGNEADDFSNNLFTDLAPLLGLFGEQFTKQFLSESFSFRERILFAMAPLGVLTAIVGAVRVGGPKWLKRLVGRARENFAEVEIELMSSVSKEVCELWDGRSIVRSRGNPQIKQIIHLPAEPGDISPESFITVDRDTWSNKYKLNPGDGNIRHTNWGILAKGLRKMLSGPPPKNANSNDEDRNVDVEAQTPQNLDHLSDQKALPSNSMLDKRKRKLKDTVGDEYKDMPPNISLNIHNGSNSIEVMVCAVVATGLQIGVLVWSWYAKDQKLSALKPVVGFWLQTIGTVVLALSLIVCAGIIDNGSCERCWSRGAKDQSSVEKPSQCGGMQLYWLQKQHTAGDNYFEPYILHAKEPNDHVLESHRRQSHRATKSSKFKYNQQSNEKKLGFSLFPQRSVQHLTTFAVIFGISGFIVQFQGLRFSNWTCAVAQLIALVIATCLRALVRRNMSKTPGAVPVENDYLLDHLTLAIIGNGSNGFKSFNSEDLNSPGLTMAFGVTTIPKLRTMSYRANSEFLSSGPQLSINAQCSREAKERLNLAKQALGLRVRLGQITKWTGAKSQEAIMLSNAIETTLKRLNPRLSTDEKCAVVVQVNTCRNVPDAPPTSESFVQEEVELMITRDGKEWKVDDAQLEALLSLLSFSIWTTKQNRKNQKDAVEETRLSSSESLGHRTEGQIVDNHQSIGWLRAKAPDSQIFERIVDISSPKLISDLSWWTTNVMHNSKAGKRIDRVQENSVSAISTGSSSSFEANRDKIIKFPTLGYYANTETSEESNNFISSHCTERQVFILHLFSAFIWAITEYVSVQDLHPASVHAISPASSASRASLTGIISAFWPSALSGQHNHYQIQSDRIEKLIQELQILGLATEEIYQVLIPPLSHFDKLPNEAMADWFGEKLKITAEQRKDTDGIFSGYTCLVKSIQDRKAQDRFANRTTAIIVNYLFRIHEEHVGWTPIDKLAFMRLNNNLRKFLEDDNKAFLMSLRSLSTILRGQGKIERINRILSGLGLDHLQLGLLPSASASEKDNFTFPNSADVFGWSKEAWKAFDHLHIFDKHFYKTVDIAGQSLLHNAIDGLEDGSTMATMRLNLVLFGFENYDLLENKQLLTAHCDEQTPLHRAAKKGQIEVVERLLNMGIDPNAQDLLGRTALCFAVRHANLNIIDMLCKKMNGCLDQQDHGGRSALFYAIVADQEDNALNLVRRKFKLDQHDEESRTPLSYAVQRNMHTLVKALIEGYTKEDWIETAKDEAERYGCGEVLEMVEDWQREKRHEKMKRAKKGKGKRKGKKKEKGKGKGKEKKEQRLGLDWIE